MPDQPPNQPRSKTDLFISFSVLALQGFGGVMAVVQRELVERRRWLTREQFVEEWAVAQIMPGPNVMNLSMMIGGRYFGLAGACAALAGMLTFPTLVVLVLAALWGGVSDAPVAQGALRGMGAVAAGLITASGLKLIPALGKNAMGWGTCGVFALLTLLVMTVLHWPLLWTLLSLGSTACLWAWVKLGATQGARA